MDDHYSRQEAAFSQGSLTSTIGTHPNGVCQ